MSIQGATSLTLQNLTIADNQATCDVCFDAGISNDTGANLTMRNVIFWNNTAGNAFNPWAIQHPAASGSNNLQYPQSRGSGQNDVAAAPGTTFADAILSPLADNGGLTQTMAIPSTSPAVNAGTSTNAPPKGSTRLQPLLLALSISARTNSRPMKFSQTDSIRDFD